MKKILVLILLALSFNSFANQEFVDFIKDKTIFLAFDDGDIHEVTFSENRLGVVTGNYRDERGKLVQGMSLKFIISDEGLEYLRLHKGLKSPSGTYRYPMLIFIPLIIESGETRTYVDARWGNYKHPLVFIEE